ncbi:MAG: hypothetical protein GF364_12755 [Candidatus Lokiarchaeota archaeon]|nr:hypothetical protein [Candidatus Lokiarchaeota archaeon]
MEGMIRMTEEYALFLGCVIPTRLPHTEKSARQVLDMLDIKLLEMDKASCCGDPIATQSLSVEMWVTIAARNICIAESMGKDILTICSGCFEVLRTANTLLAEDTNLKERVNLRLKDIGMEYKGTSKVYHYLEIISKPEYLEKIKALSKNPLKDIRISSHYECHLVRPSEIIQFENPERPSSMDKIIKALGGTPVDTPEKLSCCGYCVKLDESVGEKLVKDKILDLQHNDIDTMAVVCPSCFLQYNQQQRAINKLTDQEFGGKKEDREKLNTPVLFLTELIAIAFGLPVKKLGLKRRAIKPKKLLSKI